MTCPFCDDILTDLLIFYVYEKQPFIGEVHELTVEFGDDILTIFPKIIHLNDMPSTKAVRDGLLLRQSEAGSQWCV